MSRALVSGYRAAAETVIGIRLFFAAAGPSLLVWLRIFLPPIVAALGSLAPQRDDRFVCILAGRQEKSVSQSCNGNVASQRMDSCLDSSVGICRFKLVFPCAAPAHVT